MKGENQHWTHIQKKNIILHSSVYLTIIFIIIPYKYSSVLSMHIWRIAYNHRIQSCL